MKKYKITAVTFIVALLIFAFWYGGNSPSLRGFNVTSENTEKPIQKTLSPTPSPTEKISVDEIHDEAPMPVEINEITTNPTEKPQKEQLQEYTENTPVPQSTDKVNSEYSCTLSIRCDTILENIALLTKEKRILVPKNGIIFAETETVFYEGETVFNVLVREMKKNKIHMEFVNTPVYNSAYIEGIANFYEFDCGELSGWMYSVNGRFPNYGCSQYTLHDGDKIEWVYTCDLGKDVGGEYSARNGK